MTLADFNDANAYVDQNKIKFINAADIEPEAREVDRALRAQLYDVFGDVANQWDHDGDPPNTPPVVRAIAGMLMAAMRYARKYSEETGAESEYAERLEKKAQFLLEGIRSGTVDVGDATITNLTKWSRDDFWPNDLTVHQDTDIPLRAFTMEMEF